MVARRGKPAAKKKAAAKKKSVKTATFSSLETQMAGDLNIEIRKPRVLIVEARFYEDIADALFEGAKAIIEASDFDYDRIDVPGALELPAAIRFAMNRKGEKAYDGFVALGCVIRGETAHFDYVAGEAASGLQLAAIETGVPISFGLLTTETVEQANERAGKGAEAARTALEMADLFARLRASAH